MKITKKLIQSIRLSYARYMFFRDRYRNKYEDVFNFIGKQDLLGDMVLIIYIY